MKSFSLAGIALAATLAAFAVGAQTPSTPGSADTARSDPPAAGALIMQDTPPAAQQATPILPGTANENRADPTTQSDPSYPLIPEAPQKSEEAAPTLPGTANENKADPTSQNSGAAPSSSAQ
jgi:hypothetical protein